MFRRWLEIGGEATALLIGPRRAGKTTLARSAFPDFAYVTLDDIDNLDWAKRDPKGLVASLGGRGIIDEIQREPKLTVAVKYAVDNEGARFVMTGSSSMGLLDAAADSLAGRIDILSLPTACWGEPEGEPTHRILDADIPLPRILEGNRLLDRALELGQFPEVVTAPDEDAALGILDRYKNTYFLRDVMQVANLENAQGMRAIMYNLVRSLGSRLEVSGFAREAGLSHATTKKYLGAVAQSQLTFQLLGYQYGPAKRFLKSSKTYPCDNGFIRALGADATRGQLVEAFAIAELEKRRKLGLIGCDQLYYYESVGGAEVDVVFEDAGLLHAVEVKSTRNPSRRDRTNLVSFAREAGRPVRAVLFHCGDERDERDGVEIVPVAALYRAGGL